MSYWHTQITDKIREIRQEWKDIYTTYQPTEQELLLRMFFEDLFDIKSNIDLKYGKNCEWIYLVTESGLIYPCPVGKPKDYYMWINLNHATDTTMMMPKSFNIKSLSPARDSTCPLWHLLYELSQSKDYHTYYGPNIFYKKHWKDGPKLDRTAGSNVYFIDIDGFESQRLTDYSTSEITAFLMVQYPFLADDTMPTYAVATGSGMHLYWILEDTETIFNHDKHRSVTQTLQKMFKSDPHAVNENRILRMPWSWNNKPKFNGNARQTILHQISDTYYSADELLHKLNEGQKVCLRLDNMIYGIECPEYYDIPSNHYEPEKIETFDIVDHEEPDVKIVNLSSTEREPYKKQTRVEASTLGKTEIELKRNKKQNGDSHKTFSSRLRMLYDWVAKHDYDIHGYRNTLLFIMANTYRVLGVPEEQATTKLLTLNMKLVVPHDRVYIIIDEVYHIRCYRLSDIWIADNLGFSLAEIDKYNIRTSEQIKKESWAKYYNTHDGADRAKAKATRTEEIYQTISNHTETSVRDLADILGIGKSAAANWKKKYIEAQCNKETRGEKRA